MRPGLSGLGVLLLATPLAAQAPRTSAPASVASSASLDTHQRRARLYLSQKRDAEAAFELRQAARLGSLDRDLGLELGRLEAAEGHPALAEQQLRSVADRFGSVHALLALARLLSERNETAAALESLRRARAIAPNSEDVLRASAEASLAAGAPLAALRALAALTRLCPTVGHYHYLCGRALLQAGDAAAAVDPLKEAARLEPRQPLALVALGRALNGRGLYGEARSRLLDGLSLAPDDADALAALAEAEAGLGESNDAEGHAQRVLALTPTHPLANLVMGMVRMKQERYADARDALLKASASDPASTAVHYQLSLAFTQLGDPSSAREHLEVYRRNARVAERRAVEARLITGFSSGGTQP